MLTYFRAMPWTGMDTGRDEDHDGGRDWIDSGLLAAYVDGNVVPWTGMDTGRDEDRGMDTGRDEDRGMDAGRDEDHDGGRDWIDSGLLAAYVDGNVVYLPPAQLVPRMRG
jgi:hypothetical protein